MTGDQKPPGLHRIIFEDEATVTNWVSFAKPMDIQDCEQELHIPIFFGGTHTTDKIGLTHIKVGKVNHLEHCPFLDQNIKN